MNKVTDFNKKKNQGEKISMVTAYDYPTAKMIAASAIDAILVGDSVAMVFHGYANTTFATREMMALHTSAVARGADDKFIVTDMPFLSLERGEAYLFDTLDLFIKAGARSVKMEGGEFIFSQIEKTIKAGIPVMGHLGLTPQTINQLGSYKVQGKKDEEAQKIIAQARELEKLGVFALILECVPGALAAHLRDELSIPVIGIGAGPEVDGQILVIDDLLGRSNSGYPKFVRQYGNTFELGLNCLNQYHQDIQANSFPSSQESYLC
ncbi:MAG: 3-methyl-2-oxobutanoate hydroxymethyltransferase [Halobacteriovoraceae bacterium]|nr:3-methyl-2-oxobutanoate hydroxymethyltransferase [Halobacteriovoraceae bacterium]|tara:strand:+ start:10124 stop:10918 length:795 start_codon:yes stop_codon:yes gene_type:complete